MKTSRYLIVVTAHYCDESSLNLETRECKDIADAIDELAMCKLEYQSALSKELPKDDFTEIKVRAFELNKHIPRLISSFELNDRSNWFGWSEI